MNSSTSKSPFIACVTIFGAGIAGLTAAHELASRGFKVRVIEKQRSLDKQGESAMQIGGMARTQYARAHTPKTLFRFDGSDAAHGSDDRSPASEVEPIGVVPGEHGFRFFPSYYHHTFDTLKKIPSGRARPSGPGATVYDNVLATTMQGVSAGGINPFVMPREPLQSMPEMLANIQNLANLGYTNQDLETFLRQITRYMASCSERRAAEFENMSFWQLLRGYDYQTGTYAYEYSEKFTTDVKFMPKVLAAFDARWGDARTNGNTYVQLFMNYLVRLAKVDGTLNGPTSEAWFEPWYDVLINRLGVEFYEGELQRLWLDELPDGTRELQYDVAWVSGEPKPSETMTGHHYVICALDVVGAERVTRDLPPVGVPGQLAGYTTRVSSEPFDRGMAVERDPHRELGLYPWDRLQTLSGIQFYYAAKFELVHGHMYFVDAPWALSSINAQQFWVDPPTLHSKGYNALLSIDVGDWDNPGRDGGPNAWRSTRLRIARETWRQIRGSLEPQRSEWMSDYGPSLPMPMWFHIDDSIVFEQRVDPDSDRVDWYPAQNTSPFLIPIVGDWHNRPDGDPWDPSLTDENPEVRHEIAPGVTQASHGGYWLHWDRLLFCGTWKRTFTRMTTMESANESARHCVNAIIDHFIERNPQPSARDHEMMDAVEAGGAAPERVLPWTQIGDYSRVWNIENEELPEFLPLKKIDKWFFAHDMPNPINPTPLEQSELQAKLPVVLSEISIGVRPFDGPERARGQTESTNLLFDDFDDSHGEREREPRAPRQEQVQQTPLEPASSEPETTPRPPGWPEHWMWPPKQTWPNANQLWDDPRRASRQPLAWMAPWPSPVNEPAKPSSPLGALGLTGLPGLDQLKLLQQLLQRVNDTLIGRPPTPATSDDPDEVEHYGQQGFGRAPTIPGLTPPTPEQLMKGFQQLAALAGLAGTPSDPLGAQLGQLRDLRRTLEDLVRGAKSGK
ncbi:NAD(P)-binding protein [Nannocystaceae bacterium ST9]